jgi:hypothetical protein
MLLATGCRGGSADPGNRPAGQERTGTTGILEAGATALQDVAPVGQMNVYLVGFHPMKDHPQEQMESHHYCNQVNEDFAQCVLFDGNTKAANLHGIEYIVSEKIFATLPDDEKRSWHPHNYEILSGQLVAPGLPDIAEKELMRKKMNSYGKTWHVWKTGVHGAANDPLPLGDPMLAWSFNRDGEAKPGLAEARDRRLGLDSGEKRRDRQDLASLARPQAGVAAIAAAFPDAKGAPEGVRDAAQ